MNTLSIIKINEYAILNLSRGKVNAINHEMVGEIRTTLSQLKSDETVKGVIISGSPHYFSAGLDVIELYNYDQEKIKSFFSDFGNMFRELFKFPKPLVCAVSGYSPAGGTVIAITADYRIMADDEKYQIGLNEMAVNVQISQNLVDVYSFNLGTRIANQFILDGKLCTPREAYDHGLVQEICPLEDIMDRAISKMQQYLNADPDIFRNTKYKLRKSLFEKLDEGSQEELEQTLKVWWKPEVRMRMKLLIDYLKNK